MGAYSRVKRAGKREGWEKKGERAESREEDGGKEERGRHMAVMEGIRDDGAANEGRRVKER